MTETLSSEFQPFTSQEARDRFLAHLEVLEQHWPVERKGRMVHTEFGRTFVRINGPADGRPVVLLPGGQSSSLVWRRLIGALSKSYRTYAIDAIYDEGHSVPTRPVRTISELCSWLDGVLDGLGLKDDIALAGQSYGCYASAEYALHASQRLSRLLWIAPVMIGAPISTEFVERMKPLVDGKRESLEAYCRWIMPCMASKHPDEFRRRIDEILLVRECYGRMFPPVRAPMMSDDDLRHIDIRTLQILGELDGATALPSEANKRVGALMPDIETVLVPSAGHDVVVAETDLVTDLVLQFLQR